MTKILLTILIMALFALGLSAIVATRVRVWARVPQATIVHNGVLAGDPEVYRSNDGEFALVLRQSAAEPEGKTLVIGPDRRVSFMADGIRIAGFLFTGTDRSASGPFFLARDGPLKLDDLRIDATIGSEPVFVIHRERNFEENWAK